MALYALKNESDAFVETATAGSYRVNTDTLTFKSISDAMKARGRLTIKRNGRGFEYKGIIPLKVVFPERGDLRTTIGMTEAGLKDRSDIGKTVYVVAFAGGFMSEGSKSLYPAARPIAVFKSESDARAGYAKWVNSFEESDWWKIVDLEKESQKMFEPGVVVSGGRLVKTNAARNAKFKVGDTAFVFDDWDSPYDGRGGKVVKVDRYVHVKFPDGNVAQFAEDELTKTANAVVSRAANAKFKIGDKVRRGGQSGVVKGVEKEPYIEVKFTNEPVTVFVHEEELVANSLRSRNDVASNAALQIGDVGVSDSTILWRMIDGGRDEPYHDEYQKRLDRMNQKNIPDDTVSILKKYGYRFKNAARSRNAVVQKALNAVVRNEYQFKDMSGKVIRTGDTVEWFDKIYKVKALSAIGGRPYDEATLEEAGGRTFVKPTHELRLVGNADTGVLRETAVNSADKMYPVYSSAGKAFMKKAEAEYARTNFRSSSDFRNLWARLTGELDRIDAIPDDEKDDIEENLHLLAGQVPYRTTNGVVAKALNASRMARNGRDALGMLTVGTKVKYGSGKTGEIVRVKKIYSHGFVEPEYTVKGSDGRTFIENEGRFEVVS